jgi:hypothetical protein
MCTAADRLTSAYLPQKKLGSNPALDPEVKLAKDLLALMEKGARQGTLYGE